MVDSVYAAAGMVCHAMQEADRARIRTNRENAIDLAMPSYLSLQHIVRGFGVLSSACLSGEKTTMGPTCRLPLLAGVMYSVCTAVFLIGKACSGRSPCLNPSMGCDAGSGCPISIGLDPACFQKRSYLSTLTDFAITDGGMSQILFESYYFTMAAHEAYMMRHGTGFGAHAYLLLNVLLSMQAAVMHACREAASSVAKGAPRLRPLCVAAPHCRRVQQLPAVQAEAVAPRPSTHFARCDGRGPCLPACMRLHACMHVAHGQGLCRAGRRWPHGQGPPQRHAAGSI